MSSSSSEDDEAEVTEQPKVLPDEESNAMVVTSISPTEHSVRPKLRAWRSYSGVLEAMAETETRAVTLAEPLRKSERNVHRPNYEEMDDSREDDSKSDSDDESRASRRCMVSTDKGNNGTVSEAVSSAELPRRVKRKASVMWRSSSSNDDGEAEGMERCKFKKREKGRGP